MAKDNINTKKGFTIIEVVLVLAIAGLIFLMVFVALPALQRSQRDTARRNDIARVDTSLTQYQTNHQNSDTTLPPASTKWDGVDPIICGSSTDAEACKFVRDYMNSGVSGTDSTEGQTSTGKKNEFKDPDGAYYSLIIQEGAYEYTGDSMDHTIYIQTGAKCQDDKAVADMPRHYAVIYRLEGAGVYCIDDQ